MNKSFQYGFSHAEIVVAIAVFGVIAAAGIAVLPRYDKAVSGVKLEQDVATLNRAVVSYLTNGGSLGSVSDLEDVVSKLKTRAASSQADQVVGLKGSFIDRRTQAVMQTAIEASSTEPRAIWNAAVQRFQVTTSGIGAKEFVLNETASAAAEEVRDMNLKHASEDNWVWDYEDVAFPGRPSYTELPVAMVVPTPPTSTGSAASPLQEPVFSISGGTYPLIDYDLSLTISNPNPAGVSQIVVSVDGGAFEIYSSSALNVSPGSTIAAYAITIDPDYWSDSATVTNTYETTPVELEIDFTVPNLVVNYGEVGGAMIPGIIPGPVPSAPGIVSLVNAAQIPLQYQNNSVFTLHWSYDGSDPATSTTGETAAPFTGGFPAQSIDYSLPRWNSATTLPIQAIAASFNTALVTDSTVAVRALSIDPIELRPPDITITGTSVIITPLTDYGDTPVDARIYYTLKGAAPGDLNGVPTSGTLYTGPFSVASARGKQIKARVYAPENYEHWFITSGVSSKLNSVKYGDIRMALLIDESGSIDTTEAADLRTGLAQFFNDEVDSGNMISMIGMGSSDINTRSDHVAESEVTSATKPDFDTWEADYRTGRVSIQADFWASALELAASNTDLNLAVIIGDGIQGNTVKMANYVSQMRANGTHVFFMGIDPGEYIYSSGTIATDPSTAIDAVLGSQAKASSQSDLSDLLSTDYSIQSSFSDLGTTLSNMTASLKAAFGE